MWHVFHPTWNLKDLKNSSQNNRGLIWIGQVCAKLSWRKDLKLERHVSGKFFSGGFEMVFLKGKGHCRWQDCYTDSKQELYIILRNWYVVSAPNHSLPILALHVDAKNIDTLCRTLCIESFWKKAFKALRHHFRCCNVNSKKAWHQFQMLPIQF